MVAVEVTMVTDETTMVVVVVAATIEMVDIEVVAEIIIEMTTVEKEITEEVVTTEVLQDQENTVEVGKYHHFLLTSSGVLKVNFHIKKPPKPVACGLVKLLYLRKLFVPFRGDDDGRDSYRRDGGRQGYGRRGGSPENQRSERVERPQIKLQPRTKPTDGSEDTPNGKHVLCCLLV